MSEFLKMILLNYANIVYLVPLYVYVWKHWEWMSERERE